MTPNYLLLIDAGHTRIKCAAVVDDDPQVLPRVLQHHAVMLQEPVPWQEIESWFAEHLCTKALLVGSNPQAVDRLREDWPAHLPLPGTLQDKSTLPLNTTVKEVQRVGVDRLLNAIAANRIRQQGQTAIIVDTGTAITVDALTSQGNFCGGAILPGVRMGASALHKYTSTLPEIDTSKLFTQPPEAIGKQTEEAIESGLYWGHVGAVRELIFRLRDELASFDRAKDSPSLLLMTGGAAPLLRQHFSQARFEPHLALQGLAIVASQATTTTGD